MLMDVWTEIFKKLGTDGCNTTLEELEALDLPEAKSFEDLKSNVEKIVELLESNNDNELANMLTESVKITESMIN